MLTPWLFRQEVNLDVVVALFVEVDELFVGVEVDVAELEPPQAAAPMAIALIARAITTRSRSRRKESLGAGFAVTRWTFTCWCVNKLRKP